MPERSSVTRRTDEEIKSSKKVPLETTSRGAAATRTLTLHLIHVCKQALRAFPLLKTRGGGEKKRKEHDRS